MEESAFPTPAINKSPKKSKRFLFLIVAIVIIIIIIFAGNKLLGSKYDKENSEITPTPTEFQNGSGEAGVAGKAAGILKDLGYLASTGNADNFNYSNVTIQVKSTKSDYLALLKKDLSASYTIGSSSSDLSATSSADALVIIGK